MSGKFSVRRLIVDEWQIFSAIRLRSLKEHGASLGVSYEDEANKPEEAWKNWLGNPLKPVFGLFAEDVLIGAACLFWDEKEKTVYMGGTYIVPNFRGRGLSALFSSVRIKYTLENFLTGQTLRAAHRVGNVAAIAASRRAGLSYERQDVRTWPDGTRGPQDWYSIDIGNLRKQLQ